MVIVKEEHFGTLERINEWIQENKLSQDRFAKLIEVNVSTVRRWNNNGMEIRRSNLQRIAEVMDCDIEYLECTQDYPRRSGRSGGSRIKLPALSLVDKYLPKIQDLLATTTQRFTYEIDPEETGDYTIEEGSFIQGDTRYYYEDHLVGYTGEIFYKISINRSEPIRKSEAEIEAFVKSILKYVSFEIKQLEED